MATFCISASRPEMSAGLPRRDRELYAPERMLAFSDGVFAVAITLLVIDLRPPEVPHADNAALLTALLGMHDKFLIFVISFGVVAVMWVGHHRKFAHIERVDLRLLWLNLAFLMTICIVPFSTAVNSTYGNLTAAILYLGTLAATSLTSALVSVYGLRMPDLVSPNLRPGLRRDLVLSPLLTAAICITAIGVSLLSLNAGRYFLFLIAPASAYAGARKGE
jgi:uncharacterized membrane protein